MASAETGTALVPTATEPSVVSGVRVVVRHLPTLPGVRARKRDKLAYVLMLVC